MVPDSVILQNESSVNSTILFGTSRAFSTTVGNLSVETSLGENILLQDAIKVPGLSVVLISLSRLFQQGYTPVITGNGGRIVKGGKLIGNLKVIDDLYTLETCTNDFLDNFSQQERLLQMSQKFCRLWFFTNSTLITICLVFLTPLLDSDEAIFCTDFLRFFGHPSDFRLHSRFSWIFLRSLL
jgi:hypothetical protein